MHLTIAAVGRVKAGPLRGLYEEYAGRLNWPLSLREVEVKRPLSVEERKREEARLLSAALPPGAVLVVLDERGANLSSETFAERLREWRDGGAAEVAFIIGGADGIDRSLRDRAGLVLCFGTMTWPHQLVRGMLVEQIYRAQQILAHHPYHRP
ncbi:MAG: 23S rRNA (pseudouridine(1915)-N(3))-methyltransferase RlmH [Rhodospirillaceae bacterium]